MGIRRPRDLVAGGSLAFGLLLLLASLPAQAVRYELKEGEQYDLCRDYVKALNAADKELPMACERHFPPEFEKFSKPEWEPMDPQAQPMRLYRQMLYLKLDMELTGDERDWRLYKEKRLDPALEKGVVQLAKSRFDIDNTGDKETVIRFARTPCKENREWFRKNPYQSTYEYYVINDKTGNLDPDYPISYFGKQGIFYYEGRIFRDEFDGMSIEPNSHKAEREPERKGHPYGWLYLYESADYGGGARTVCKIEVYYEFQNISQNIDKESNHD
jgi:hypothetical protein